MIFTNGLSKRFDEFLAVDNVTLEIPDGEILVLLGPNGAGKTTTVRMLTSILTPSQGWATVNGFDVVHNSSEVRRIVGVLTEHHGLYGRMNAEEYLIFFGELYGLTKEASLRRVLPLLDQFGLGSDRRRRLGEFSKGMRQKLALVRALINDPPVLLLDEPTSAMDPESARMVRNAILGLKSKERTIILCTHNLYEAEELADQIAIIRNGKIIFNDQIKRLKSKLLGYPIYEVTIAGELDSFRPTLPEGVKILSSEKRKMVFEVQNPDISNPILIREILKSKDIISFQEMPKRLEDAYLKAVNRVSSGDDLYAQ